MTTSFKVKTGLLRCAREFADFFPNCIIIKLFESINQFNIYSSIQYQSNFEIKKDIKKYLEVPP